MEITVTCLTSGLRRKANSWHFACKTPSAVLMPRGMTTALEVCHEGAIVIDQCSYLQVPLPYSMMHHFLATMKNAVAAAYHSGVNSISSCLEDLQAYLRACACVCCHSTITDYCTSGATSASAANALHVRSKQGEISHYKFRWP